MSLLRPLGLVSTWGLLFFAISSDAQRADQVLKAAGTPSNPKVPIAWNRYYDSEALEALCRKIAEAHPGLAKLQGIGKSREGKTIWALTITDFKKGQVDRKRGIYIQGNIHGNEIQGGEYALYTAWYLTENFQDVRFIQDLLGSSVFYIVPTINPDSRDYFMHQPTTESDPRGYVGHYHLQYRDLDGDGNIALMRWKNPNGIWRIDPHDPRRMIELTDAEKIMTPHGEWIATQPDDRNYSVMLEGGDTRELYQTTYPRKDDPNRDWDNSPFPEIRSVQDFFLQHANIAAAVSFHDAAGEIYRGTVAIMDESGKDNGQRDDGNDVNLYAELGKHAEELLPGYAYKAPLNAQDDREIDWMFRKRGAYSFIIELASPYMLYHKKESFGGAFSDEMYEFSRDFLFDDPFIPWHAFNHPTLGKIEIGGFKKNYAGLRLTPGFLMEAEAHRNMAFCLYLAREMPDLEVREVTVKDRSDGLREVTALIANTHLIPTHSGPDLAHNLVRPDYVTLQAVAGGEAQVVSAETQIDRFDVTARLDKEIPGLVAVDNIPGRAAIAVRWVIRGSRRGKYSVTVDSAKGGVVVGSSR